MNIFLDIETLPGDGPDVMGPLLEAATKEKEAVKAPSNYKDEAKIIEYVSARHAEIDASIEEKRRRTSFDGLYGSIACIAYAFDDGEIYSVDCLESEEKMLMDFYLHVLDKTAVAFNGGLADIRATVIGHNVCGFDLPFLKHRSIILSLPPVPAIRAAMNAKPWSPEVADTMLMWSPEREKRVSLDKLCRALGIPGKDGFDGSMVADAWASGPEGQQKVIDYCKDDVERVRSIYNRLTFSRIRAEEQTQASAAEPINNVAAIIPPQQQPATDDGGRIKLGEINELLHPISLSADALKTFGFEPAETQGAAKLYKVSDFDAICATIIRHVQVAAGKHLMKAA